MQRTEQGAGTTPDMTLFTENTLTAHTRRYGPLVNRQLLIELITPELEKVGTMQFARQAGVDFNVIRRMLKGQPGHDRPRLWLADKLLTKGCGRPDLVGLVCLDVVESAAGAASSPSRGRTPRRLAVEGDT